MAVVLDAADRHHHDRVLEAGVVGGDDEVHRPDQVEGTGDGATLHRGDGRLGEVAPLPAVAEVLLRLPPVELVEVVAAVGFGELGLVGVRDREVVARGEVLALGAQHDHADVVVALGRGEAGVELVEHPLVLGVRLVGAVHRDRGDASVHLVAHVAQPTLDAWLHAPTVASRP